MQCRWLGSRLVFGRDLWKAFILSCFAESLTSLGRLFVWGVVYGWFCCSLSNVGVLIFAIGSFELAGLCELGYASLMIGTGCFGILVSFYFGVSKLRYCEHGGLIAHAVASVGRDEVF